MNPALRVLIRALRVAAECVHRSKDNFACGPERYPELDQGNRSGRMENAN